MKNYIKIVLLCIVAMITLQMSSCGEPKITTFDSVSVENSMNNLRAGGNLAYFDNTLYVNFSNNTSYFGTYALKSDGVIDSLLLSDTNDPIYDMPKLYSNNNQLYADWNDSVITKYNSTTKKFEKFENSVVNRRETFYLSDDLFVYNSGHSKIKVKYKDKKEFAVDEKVDQYYVIDDVIYYFSNWQKLKKLDPSKEEKTGETIGYIEQYDGIDPSVLTTDSLYFVADAVYRYSLESGNVEKILEEDEVTSMNAHGDKAYIATKNNIYVADSTQCTKLSGKKVDEIYIFDEDWIYALKDGYKIYRISVDGETVEKINLVNYIVDDIV